jgi:hypothetical protein
MRIIHKKRQTGKTTELIKEAAKKDLYMVCMNKDTVNRVVEEAVRMDLHINYPLTFSEFFNHRFNGRGIKGFLIDDADMLIKEMSKGVPIEAIVINRIKDEG